MYDLVRENSYATPVANSSLLPLMLLSLATQKHSPSNIYTVDSIWPQYDFIIVGAGSAGSTLAARLSELPCVNVLVLEAGPTPPLLTEVPAFAAYFYSMGSDVDWDYKTVPQKYTARLQKGRRIPWPSGKSVGGSSVINTMLYVRGNRKNYDDWEAEGATGWGYGDVLPYFKKLEDMKSKTHVDPGYHGKGGPVTVENAKYDPPFKASLFNAASEIGYETIDPNGRRQTGFYDIQGTNRNHQRCSVAKAYLVPAENRSNLHILPNVRVHKVLIENHEAVGVLFEANGTLHQVKATREVILSAGTVNTAQLLMLSGIGPKKELNKHKIPVVMNLPVGENFHNHVTAHVGFEMDPNTPPLKQKLTEEKIKEYINNRTGILTSFLFLTGLAFLNPAGPHAEDFPTIQLYLGEYPVSSFKDVGMNDQAYDQTYKAYENKPTYFCGSTIIQPRSRGYVRLQSSDPRAPPLINPRYLADPGDLQDIVEGMKLCYKLGTTEALRKAGFRPLNITLPGCEKHVHYSEEYFRCHARSLVRTRSHQVGTARMGHPDDPRTVVDSQLRVKGIKRLRVVDASVMPIVPSGNTYIPTIMVAEKVAIIIRDGIICQQPAFAGLDASAGNGGPADEYAFAMARK